MEKAEADLATAKRELRARKLPNYDAACFHAQQCAEKYMKAVLTEENLAFERIHKLPILLDSLVKVEAWWEVLRLAAQHLTDYAVHFRYPGSIADKQMARDAVKAADLIREQMREHLKISEPTQSSSK